MASYKYYLKTKGINIIKIMPNPSTAFTDDEFIQIIEKVRNNLGGVSVKRVRKHIQVLTFNLKTDLDTVRCEIESLIPKHVSELSLEIERKELLRKNNAIRAEENINKALNANPEALNWINYTFYDADLNNFNKHALLLFITGKHSKFSGILNKTAYNTITEMSIDGVFDINRCKEMFEQHINNRRRTIHL